jgi:cyanophycinase
VSSLPTALLGSGEFEPWSEAVDRWALERSRSPDGVVLVVPTAAAHEGEASFAAWGAKGLEHFARLGIHAEVLPLRTRDDAEDDAVVGRLDGAALVYFSGGNPARLAAVLDGSRFWADLTDAHRDGLPYVGCSAGVAVLPPRTFDSDTQSFETMWQPGLGYVRGVLFGPHWDIVDTWVAGASTFIVDSVAPGEVFVGLDEDTAILGDGRAWSVAGRQGVHVLVDGAWSSYREGDRFDLDLAIGG